MEIKSTILKRCALLIAAGRVDSATAPQLQAALEALTDEGTYKIVIDMKDVDFISSAGLWVLVNSQKTCKRFNRGEVVLAGIAPRVQSALELAGFGPYFRQFDESTQAVGSF